MTYQKFTIIVLQISDKSETDKVGVMLHLDEKMEALESRWSQLSPLLTAHALLQNLLL